MAGAVPLPPPPPPAPLALPRRDRSGRATAALVCGIAALVSGFLLVTLLLAVVANVLGSYALQDMSRDPSLGGRGTAQAGIACAVAAIVVWGTAVVVLLATGGA